MLGISSSFNALKGQVLGFAALSVLWTSKTLEDRERERERERGSEAREDTWETRKGRLAILKRPCCCFGFKKALLQNPRKMIRGRIFREMIRIRARKSELQAESRSYRPKVRDTARQTPRIRTESPRKRPRMGFRCFYRKPPLKPSWIHLSHVVVLEVRCCNWYCQLLTNKFCKMMVLAVMLYAGPLCHIMRRRMGLQASSPLKRRSHSILCGC